MIYALRLNHRKERDKRITTHIGLVARAFGADGVILTGERDENVLDTWKDVRERWGGPFDVKYAESWRKVVEEWEGAVVHLTMYGIPVDDAVESMRGHSKDILVVVGGEKTPSEMYKMADYNVAVGNQPHSEVAALAIFLDRWFRGKELSKEFKDWQVKVLPSRKGKQVIKKDFGKNS